MQKSPNTESISPESNGRVRAMCPCCSGGEHRPGKRYTKSKSHDMNYRRRGKWDGAINGWEWKGEKKKKINRRDRARNRPDKFGG